MGFGGIGVPAEPRNPLDRCFQGRKRAKGVRRTMSVGPAVTITNSVGIDFPGDGPTIWERSEADS